MRSKEYHIMRNTRGCAELISRRAARRDSALGMQHRDASPHSNGQSSKMPRAGKWRGGGGIRWKSHKARENFRDEFSLRVYTPGFSDEGRVSKAINRVLAASGVHRPIVHRFHPRPEQKRPAIINRSSFHPLHPTFAHRLINRILISFVRTRLFNEPRTRQSHQKSRGRGSQAGACVALNNLTCVCRFVSYLRSIASKSPTSRSRRGKIKRN